jgi:GNAT superfamily N-acetyltransferase
MKFTAPTLSASEDCERILRTLPDWFGVEESLLEYVRDTARYPTFLAQEGGKSVAFLTVHENFPRCWEVRCIAVQASNRSKGIGRSLHQHVETWLEIQGAHLLQVKTLASSHPSPEYAQTREFYSALGYRQHEVFPTLWGPGLPVLQLVKVLAKNAA